MQDRSVMSRFGNAAPNVFRGKRNLQHQFLRDVIADHRGETHRTADLAKVDLLSYSHALKRRGLFENVEMNMSNRKAAALAAINDFVAEETAPKKSRHDTMREIEEKHLGRCIDQVWAQGRRALIELMEVRGTARTAVVVKRFEERVSLSSSKPWPELSGAWVYFQMEDKDNSWAELDRQLAEYREAHKIA